MKIRIGFVTNSSSAMYIVKNKTGQTKTLLDLIDEAACGPWMLIGWPYSDYDNWNGMDPLPLPEDPKLLQDLRESVALTQTFPQYSVARVEIAWGEGGPIFSPYGLRSGTRSFSIIDVT
jgi:hypothetical protein